MRNEITFEDVEDAILKIQRQSRVYLSCRRFRQCLYRLILLKNIIESKVNKEQMFVLYAFEQLIVNTEDPNNESEINNESEADRTYNFDEKDYDHEAA